MCDRAARRALGEPRINFFNASRRLMRSSTDRADHPAHSMVMEGVFERFPKLRVAYLEAGAAGCLHHGSPRSLLRGLVGQAVQGVLRVAEEKPSEYIRSADLLQLRGRRDHPALRDEAHRPQAVLFASDFDRDQHRAREARDRGADEPRRAQR